MARLVNLFACVLILVAIIGAGSFALLEHRSRLKADSVSGGNPSPIVDEPPSTAAPPQTFLVSRAEDSPTAEDGKSAAAENNAAQTPTPPWTPDTPGPTPSPAYAKLDRTYSFAEVEAILEKREKGGQ